MMCALRVFLGLTFITGLGYPLIVTGVGSVLMPHAASGSLIRHGEVVVGSALLGQEFTSIRYFWGRPSGTSASGYNGAAGSGRNLAPTNPDLLTKVKTETERIFSAHGGKSPVPVDLVTASGSGLDPHISPAAAEYQAERVAKARGVSVDEIRSVIAKSTEEPTFGLFGHSRVNVLQLNLALDARETSR